MTAFAVIRTAEAIVVTSDGVFYDGNGIVRGAGSKVVIVAEWPGVIVAQTLGEGGFLQFVRLWLGQATFTFEEALKNLVTASRKALANVRKGSAADFNLAIAGWSAERSRFETYALTSIGETDTEPLASGQIAPWQLTPVPNLYGINPEAEQYKCFGLNRDWRPEPVDYARRIIWANRYSKFPPKDGNVKPFHSAGMFLQETLIYRDRIETSIVHRWPDKIGVRIETTNDGPLPVFV